MDIAESESLSAQLEGLLNSEDWSSMVALLDSVRPADAADLLESLDDELLALTVEHWTLEGTADALGELEESRRGGLAERLPPARLAGVLDVMAPDQAAHFLGGLDPQLATRILARMGRSEAVDVAELLDFPEGSAGRRMSQDFVSVAESETADEVIERLRRIPEDVELIYYVYVLGGSEQLKGIVSLRSLIVAQPQTTMADLMMQDVIAVPPTEDLESVAEMVRRYNLIAMPVIDDLGRMLGIVTVDDLLEEMEDESQRDVLRFAGSIEDSIPVPRHTWLEVRRRLPWLIAAAVIEIVLAYFLLRPLPKELLIITVSYIPLLVFIGGNTAVQAAARVLVRLGQSRSETSGPWRQARREAQAGLFLALLAALATFPLLAIFGRGIEFAAVVAPAVALTVASGAALGAVLPILLQKVKLDPSIASGPLLGSAMDIISLLIYVTLALNFSQFVI